MHLYLIRHGRQTTKDCGADVPLCDTGRQQARLLAERFSGKSMAAEASLSPDDLVSTDGLVATADLVSSNGLALSGSLKVSRILSSPLLRASETAEILSSATGLPCEYREELKEIDYGKIAGLDFRTRFYRYADFYRQRSQTQDDIPYPGGENLQDVWRRIKPVLDELIAENALTNEEATGADNSFSAATSGTGTGGSLSAAASGTRAGNHLSAAASGTRAGNHLSAAASGSHRGGDIAIVTHLEAIRAILCGALHLPFSCGRRFTGKLEHTSVTSLYYSEKDGTWQLDCYNDAVHLLPYPDLQIRAWRE